MSSNEPRPGAVAPSRYALPAILLGIALLAVSFLPLFASGRESWTKEQALELQQASMRIQELTHKLGSKSRDTASRQAADDYQQALDHFQLLQSELKDAQSRNNSLAPVLRMLGLLMAIGGAANLAAAKRKKTAELPPMHTTRPS